MMRIACGWVGSILVVRPQSMNAEIRRRSPRLWVAAAAPRVAVRSWPLFFFFFYPHQRTHIHKISHRQCCIKQATRELSTGRISAHLLNEVEEVEVVGYAKLRKVKHRQKHDEYRLLGWELHLSLNFLVLKVEFLLYVAKL